MSRRMVLKIDENFSLTATSELPAHVLLLKLSTRWREYVSR